MTARYADGRDKELQRQADARYRQSRTEKVHWLNELASGLNVPPHELMSTSAEAVADLIRNHYRNEI